ncbi:hypothetical protein FSARC_2648 [Fusarium sarcochroum]|uniref:Uncharacterized protein n=1 Tax=Fusarium sarcochroum TaxID=1208366 RepID=A0A8H4U6C3_9HYPO|nr:hypothetical protein FSARC_2648 [Fusarium sarcochroum]
MARSFTVSGHASIQKTLLESSSATENAAPVHPHPVTEADHGAPGSAHPPPRVPRARPTSRPSRPEPASQLGEASGSQRVDAESPAWLQEHIVNWQIPPRTLRYLGTAWKVEAFDYFKSGAPLPSYLRGVEGQLRREWAKQQREAPKSTT